MLTQRCALQGAGAELSQRLLRLFRSHIVGLRNLAKFEPCFGFTVQIISVLVKKAARKGPLQVCLLSPPPLVLSEFERVLVNPAFKLVSRHLESTLGPDLRHLQVPRAVIYVVDAHVARPAAGALLSNIDRKSTRLNSSHT